MAFHPARPNNPKVGDMWFDPIANEHYIWTGNGWMLNGPTGSPGNITIGNKNMNNIAVDAPITFHEEPKHMKFQVKTNYGVIVANLNTGELTLPAGVARDAALKEFWMGFLEHYNAGSTDQSKKIRTLELKVAAFERGEHIAKEAIKANTKSDIIKKFNAKYGNEKLIMLKPSDLVKLIEE